MEKTIKAKAKHIRIAPRKVRLLVDMIRNMSVNEAEAILLSSPQRSRNVLLKLLRSAVANAKDILKIETSVNLFIKEIRVDGGQMLKRWRARARGGIGRIQKKTSHITVILGVSESEQTSRFLIINKKKKKKEPKKGKNKKTDDLHLDSGSKNNTTENQTSKKGVIPKIFNRKSI